MKRILCLWFPNWPVQRRLGAQPELKRRPLVLHAPVAGKPRVTACSRSARQLGVKPGMLLAEAEALCASAGAAFETHDPRADRDALRRLARWGQQFTPLAAVEEAESPDCLLLDVTGCGYSFGGLEGLAQTAVTRLRGRTAGVSRLVQCSVQHQPADTGRSPYFAAAAVADTVGAAWALAHHGADRVRVVPPGAQVEALKPLPIEALRLPAATIDLLHTFDVRRIEQLLALPRGELPCRFGAALLHRLDQALGAASELIEPEQQDDPIEASWPFDPPIADGRLLDQALAYLLDRVLERLRPRQLGAQRLLCSLKLASGEPVCIPVGLVRPSATFSHLIGLLRLHLERVRVTGEIADVTIHVPSVAPLEFRQNEMFGESPGSQPLADLLERLSSRLGETAVLRPELQADAQPEFAWRSEHLAASLATRCERVASDAAKCVFRPPRLQHRPVAIAVMSVVPGGPPLSFEWNRRAFRIAQSWGPERIETGWWRGDDIRRDYYQVETPAGERYWLFRRLPDERWFLHGVFA